MIHEKYEALKAYLKSFGTLAVAYSSGVDSTFLLHAAVEALGTENVIAITAVSASFPARERDEAGEYCASRGIRHFYVGSEELQVEGFTQNPPNRCYLCKKQLFGRIMEIARNEHMAAVAEGSNMDDNGDYRPGLIAVRELGVLSPLRHAEFYKEEIREMSKGLGLPTWKKPSFACLASRFVYGEPITAEKLHMVELAEDLLWDMGFEQFRVRIHGTIARVEVLPSQFSKVFEGDNREKIYNRLKEIGFSYVSLDLGGYRTGSMNEVLSKELVEQVQADAAAL